MTTPSDVPSVAVRKQMKREVVPAVESIGIWKIISDSHESFGDGTGEGISLTASAIISNETEDQLHQRLLDIIAKEISNPLTARLIDKRFQ